MPSPTASTSATATGPERIAPPGDRLAALLERFPLKARVYQAGVLRSAAPHPAEPGFGQLHVVERGRIRVRGPGRTQRTIEAPALVLFVRSGRHHITPLDAEVRMVCARFEFGLGDGNPIHIALPEPFECSLAELPSLAAVTHLLFAEAREDHCGRQAVLDRLMETVLILMLRDLMDRGLLRTGLLAGLADPRLARALNALHAAPADRWTLDTLARTAGMSRARFADRFLRITGIPPGRYLTDWRLGVARTLLLEGQPLARVANAVGYATASAFSRAFSARHGIAPGRWLRERRRQSA